MAKQRGKNVNISTTPYSFIDYYLGYLVFIVLSDIMQSSFYHIAGVSLKYLFNILSLQLYSAHFLIFCLIL